MTHCAAQQSLHRASKLFYRAPYTRPPPSPSLLPPLPVSTRHSELFSPAPPPQPPLAHIGAFLEKFRHLAEATPNGGRLESMGEVRSTDGAAAALPLYAWTRRVLPNAWLPPASQNDEQATPFCTPTPGQHAAHQINTPADSETSTRRLKNESATPPSCAPTSGQQAARPTKGPLDSETRARRLAPSCAPRPPRIYISSGIHGDEAAGPLALLELLAEGFFDDRAHWFICPVLNPLGLARGTRENPDGLDLNRDYLAPRSAEIRAHLAWLQRQPPFDLTLCLHEDWESTGFYLYEHNPNKRPSLAPALLDSVLPHLPIEPETTIDGRDVDEPGILRPKITAAEMPTWPEALYLREHGLSDLGYTTETPSSLPLPQRVAAQKALIATALTTLLHDLSASP